MVSKAQHEADVNSIEATFARFNERKNLAMAPAWRPNPGDTIAIEVCQLKLGPDQGHGVYPIVVGKMMDTGAPVAIHAFHTMLRESLRDLKCNVSMRLIISYIGEVAKNKPNAKGEFETYNSYYVEELKLDDTSDTAAVQEGFTFD